MRSLPRCCQPDDAGVSKHPWHHWDTSSKHSEDATVYNVSSPTPALQMWLLSHLPLFLLPSVGRDSSALLPIKHREQTAILSLAVFHAAQTSALGVPAGESLARERTGNTFERDLCTPNEQDDPKFLYSRLQKRS